MCGRGGLAREQEMHNDMVCRVLASWRVIDESRAGCGAGV